MCELCVAEGGTRGISPTSNKTYFFVHSFHCAILIFLVPVIVLPALDERKIECGRPFGMRVVGDKLVVTDTCVGLMEIDLESGSKHTLVPFRAEIAGTPLTFPNDVAFAPDGK